MPKRIRPPEYKEYSRKKSAEYRKKNPISFLISTAKYRAKIEGMDFNLTLEELEIPIYCPVFGLKLQFNPGRRKANSYSLDRKDNSKGYTKDNVKIISFKANQYKGDMTIEEVESLLKYMKGE